jgi:hypothetical protein
MRANYASVDNVHVSIQNNSLSVSNYTKKLFDYTPTGYSRKIYSDTKHGESLMIVEKGSPVFYVLTFRTHPVLFDYYWPTVKRMFESFDIQTRQLSPSLNKNNSISFMGANIPFDENWEIIKSKQSPPQVKLVPEPYYTNIVFRTTLGALSFPTYGSAQADYTTSLSWDSRTGTWKSAFNELQMTKSPVQASMKYLQNAPVNSPNFKNSISTGSHVDLELDLDAIGSPENYVVISEVTSTYLKKNGQAVCLLKDFTNWIPLPPPKIELQTNPDSLTIRQGEIKQIQLSVNSSVPVPAILQFNASFPDFDKKTSPSVHLRFTKQNLTIPAKGFGGTALNVGPYYNASNVGNSTGDILLNLDAEAYFPLWILDTSSTLAVQDNEIESIKTMTSPVRLTILSPSNIQEQVTDVFRTSASALAEFGAVVTTVGTIAASFIIVVRWLSKRKALAEGQKEGQEEDS